MKESVVVIRKELGSRLDDIEQKLQALQSVPPVNSFSTPTRSNGQFVKSLTDQPKPASNLTSTPAHSNGDRPKSASSLTSTPTHNNGQFVKPLTEITNQPVQNDTATTKPASSLTPPLRQASISTPSPKLTSSISNQLLKKILLDKEQNPLPSIDKSTLVQPMEVLEKYPKLICLSKIPTLAVRLSKEAYFGKSIMAKCTVRGTGSYHALPEEELTEIKGFLFGLCHPRMTTTRCEFENTWKSCVDSIGQACKALRTSSSK